MQYTEERARREGLEFTGVYESSYNREKAKARLEEFRKQGYRAVLVNVPPNPLSRGYDGGGVSVYIEARYHKDQEAKRLRDLIEGYSGRCQAIRAECDEKLKQEFKRNEDNKRWLIENGYPA